MGGDDKYFFHSAAMMFLVFYPSQISEERAKLPIASFRDVITSTVESNQVFHMILLSGVHLVFFVSLPFVFVPAPVSFSFSSFCFGL